MLQARHAMGRHCTQHGDWTAHGSPGPGALGLIRAKAMWAEGQTLAQSVLENQVPGEEVSLRADLGPVPHVSHSRVTTGRARPGVGALP